MESRIGNSVFLFRQLRALQDIYGSKEVSPLQCFVRPQAFVQALTDYHKRQEKALPLPWQALRLFHEEAASPQDRRPLSHEEVPAVLGSAYLMLGNGGVHSGYLAVERYLSAARVFYLEVPSRALAQYNSLASFFREGVNQENPFRRCRYFQRISSELGRDSDEGLILEALDEIRAALKRVSHQVQASKTADDLDLILRGAEFGYCGLHGYQVPHLKKLDRESLSELSDFGRFLKEFGLDAEARQLFQDLNLAVQRLDRPIIQAYAWGCLGNTAFQVGFEEDALEFYAEAVAKLKDATEDGDRWLKSPILIGISTLAHLEGAEQLIEKILAPWQKADTSWWESLNRSLFKDQDLEIRSLIHYADCFILGGLEARGIPLLEQAFSRNESYSKRHIHRAIENNELLLRVVEEIQEPGTRDSLKRRAQDLAGRLASRAIQSVFKIRDPKEKSDRIYFGTTALGQSGSHDVQRLQPLVRTLIGLTEDFQKGDWKQFEGGEGMIYHIARAFLQIGFSQEALQIVREYFSAIHRFSPEDQTAIFDRWRFDEVGLARVGFKNEDYIALVSPLLPLFQRVDPDVSAHRIVEIAETLKDGSSREWAKALIEQYLQGIDQEAARKAPDAIYRLLRSLEKIGYWERALRFRQRFSIT